MARYTMTPTQRAVLARVAFGEPLSQTETYNWSDGSKEALATLRANAYVMTSNETIDRRPLFVVTEEGGQSAMANQHTAARARVQTCPCCVVVSCVCSVSIRCMGDGPHDVGCHGSHD